jgi:hypothetical protein
MANTSSTSGSGMTTGATAGTTTGAGGASVAGSDVAVDETHRLISADKVEGTNVYNRAGDSLGSIYGLMIDKVGGRVAYAVMSFGGFLGIGERYHPLPWGALTYDTSRGGYVVDLSREQLEGAPSYGSDEEPWDRPGYGRTVND